MAGFSCPHCQKELKKGEYPKWVRWFIGPIFGNLLRPLICDEHGEIALESFSPEAQSSIRSRRTMGLIFGIIINIAFIILIIWGTVADM